MRFNCFIVIALFVLTQGLGIEQAGAEDLSHQAYTLEAFGHYKKASALRIRLAKTFARPADPQAVQNLILAGADLYEGGEHCAAISTWRRVLRFAKQPLFDGDLFAEHGSYPAAFSRYGALFNGDTIPTNAIFIDTGSVLHLRIGLQAGARGDFVRAEKEINKAISVFPPFPWGLLMYGDVLDALHRRSEAVSTWVTALRAQEPVPADSPPDLSISYVAIAMLFSREGQSCAFR